LRDAVGMTRPQVRAIIEDGPRAGETIVLDVASDDSAPREIMLPDGHQGTRGPGELMPHPTGAVSRYRLMDSDDRGGFHYKVVPHEQ
jgi:hypothetical protein